MTRPPFGGSSDLLPGMLVIPAAAAVGLAVVLLGGEAWLMLVAGGLGLAAFGAHRLWYAAQSHAWPQTVGTVTSAGIGAYSLAESKTSRRTYFYPEIEFSYTIQGLRYSGTRAALDVASVWSPDRQVIERLMEKFAPTTEVPVYANPARPADAVLVPGLSPVRRSHYLHLLQQSNDMADTLAPSNSLFSWCEIDRRVSHGIDQDQSNN